MDNVNPNFPTVDSLNMFSKIYKLFIEDQTTFEIDKFLFQLFSTYRKSYHTYYVITYMIDGRRGKLDQVLYVGEDLTDLSKTFDCNRHDLLSAWLEAYGFDEISLLFTYSHLKNHKQCVRINDTHTSFENMISK